MSTYIEQRRDDGVEIIVLKNEDIEVWLTTLGAAILKLIVKDKNGEACDVAAGYETLEDYPKYRDYLGATVGRTANRIREGKFTLNGIDYQLPINNGPNCNHGGIDGFSFRNFKAELKENSVIFRLHSPDGEEGYPGNLDFQVEYSLNGPELTLHYMGESDADTLLNVTNHTYFNLSGKPEYIGDHILKIDADKFGATNADGLFTGELLDVENTDFDFRIPDKLDKVLKSDHEQIKFGYGLDHGFMLNSDKDQVVLYSPESGIEMTVSTTMPMAQLYTANYFNNFPGKYGQVLPRQGYTAIECQYPADDINIRKEDSKTILRKGEQFDESTSFKFNVK